MAVAILGAALTINGFATRRFPFARPAVATEGDTIVVRHQREQLAGREIVLTREVTIGGAHEPDDYQFSTITFVTPLRSGGILLYEGHSKEVRQFGRDGQFVRRIGRSGTGPGEYRVVTGIAEHQDGRLVIWNGQTNILVYSSDGRFVSSWPVPVTRPLSLGNGGGIDADGRVSTVVTIFDVRLRDSSGTAARPTTFAAVRSTMDGKVIDSVVRPVVPKPDRLLDLEFGGRSFVMSLPFSPTGHAAYSQHGFWAHGSSDRYSVTISPKAGTPARLEVDIAVIALAEGEREWWRQKTERQAKSLSSAAAVSLQDIPRHKPYFAGIDVDADGRLWIQLHGTGTWSNEAMEWEEKALYHVLSSAGAFLGSLTLPARTAFAAFSNDSLWLIQFDESDVPNLVKYKIRFSA
jgi:hypothetical protein